MSLLKSVRTATAPPVRPTVRPVHSGRRAVLEPLVFAVVVSVIHLLVGQSLQFVLTVGVTYALLTAGLGVLLGWSGIYSFGHAVFFGIGAYSVGLLKDHELSPPLLLLVGAVVAAVGAALVGALGARIVAVEFAMLTLMVGQVVYLLTFRVDLLQGDNGLYGIPAGTIAGRDLVEGQNLWWYTVVVVAVLLGVLRRVQLSPYGASLNAVRDDPVKAAAIGLPVRALRLSAFTLSGAVAGVAGALFAQQQGIVTPTTLTFTFSGQIIIMLLLGGLHRFWGPVVGAIVFVVLNNRLFGETTHPSLVLGLILLVIVVLLPRGLLGLGDTVTGLVRRGRRS